MSTDTETMTPQPGDVVIDREGRRAVIDGSHFGWDLEDGRGPIVLAIANASAFRGSDRTFGGAVEDAMTGAVRRGRDAVSCSGGPCPFVPLSALTYAGETTQRFWRWRDGIARAHNGEDYTATVALWSWEGEIR